MLPGMVAVEEEEGKESMYEDIWPPDGDEEASGALQPGFTQSNRELLHNSSWCFR